MNLLALISLLSVVYSVFAGTKIYPRGCIYVDGQCQEECEVGTHAYTIGCGYLTPEATCDEPSPTPDERAHVCDFSDCYCDPPTVRDPNTNKCVHLEECKKMN